MGRMEPARACSGRPRRGRLDPRPRRLLGASRGARSSRFGFRAGPAEIRPSPVAVDAGHERPSPLYVRSPRARSAKLCALRGDNRGRPANAGRSAVRPSRESKIRSPLSLWPPVTWDHGLRLWLKSAASGRLCRSCCFWWAKALGGETKISYRPSCPSSGGSLPQDQV